MFCSLFLFIMKIHPFMNPKLNEKFGEFQFGIKGKILNKKLKLISGKFSHWNLFGFLFVLNQYIYRTTMHGIKKKQIPDYFPFTARKSWGSSSIVFYKLNQLFTKIVSDWKLFMWISPSAFFFCRIVYLCQYELRMGKNIKLRK